MKKLFILALLLAGCAHEEWVKYGATPQDFRKDSAFCASNARAYKIAEAPYTDWWRYDLCMHGRGYAKASED